MSLSDLPNLWTEPTKIGYIFRKQSTYFKNQSFQNISFIKVDLLVKYSSEKKNQKDLVDFWCRKMTLKVQILQTLRRLFIILVGLTMTWFSEKMLILNIFRRGLMPNLINKSWTVSMLYFMKDLKRCLGLGSIFLYTEGLETTQFFSLFSNEGFRWRTSIRKTNFSFCSKYVSFFVLVSIQSVFRSYPTQKKNNIPPNYNFYLHNHNILSSKSVVKSLSSSTYSDLPNEQAPPIKRAG